MQHQLVSGPHVRSRTISDTGRPDRKDFSAQAKEAENMAKNDSDGIAKAAWLGIAAAYYELAARQHRPH